MKRRKGIEGTFNPVLFDVHLRPVRVICGWVSS
jgi:hypothetical protein